MTSVPDAANCIIGIGSNEVRKKISDKLVGKADSAPAYWPSSARVASTATVGNGTFINAKVIVGPGTVIGRHCIINPGATIGHDCALEDYTFVGAYAVMVSFGG